MALPASRAARRASTSQRRQRGDPRFARDFHTCPQRPHATQRGRDVSTVTSVVAAALVGSVDCSTLIAHIFGNIRTGD